MYRLTQSAQVIERILARYQDIGGLAALDRTGLAAQPQELGIDLRGRMQRKGVAHADILGKIGHLTPHVVLRHERAARICAKAHLNASFQRRTSTLDNARAHDVAVLLLRVSRMGLLRIEQHKR